MFVIRTIKARQILDSRGNPTVEVDLLLNSGAFGRASVPSGASVGSREAIELRDVKDLSYCGNCVKTAVQNVNEVISSAILKRSFTSQAEFDNKLIDLDGTENKSILGANAILASSIAFAKACASQLKIPLFKFITDHKYKPKMPIPMMNFINGGMHADNLIDFQEFMIIPYASSIEDSLEISYIVFNNLKNILKKAGYNTNVGDEGGFAPNLKSTSHALDILSEAITYSGFKFGKDISIALDVAANELMHDGLYHLASENLKFTPQEFALYHKKLVDTYNISSIEDPMAENDIIGWQTVTESIGSKVQLVGDDIFVTNKKYLQHGIDCGIANALLVKMNQIGTLTETLEAVDIAYQNGYEVIVSHRSGETEDVTMSHLSVGIGSKYIKAGAICRTDRVCKYNELLRIVELL